MEEVNILNEKMKEAGVQSDTAILLSFIHFGSDEANVQDLSKQLSDNYDMKVTKSDNNDYWIAEGTTEPYTITMTSEDHIQWVDFMSDVARSYACMFSTWSVVVPDLSLHFTNEHAC